MDYIVNEDFLWFKREQVISQSYVEDKKINPLNVEQWVDNGHISPVGEEIEPDFDLNGDGEVDKEDITIAAKLLGKTRQKRNSSKKKKN